MYRPRNCLRCGGKYKKMQTGGCFDANGFPVPCQQLSGTGQADQSWKDSETPSNVVPVPVNPDPAYSTRIQQEPQGGYDINPIRQKNNGDWVINRKGETDPFRVALGLQTETNALSWLSGIVDRRRQNRYMYDQYSTLGQNEAQPVSNFQPNPYNLYARYGGYLKKYMMGYTNQSENPAFPTDEGMMRTGGLTPNKAREILHDGTVHGHKITEKQRRFFGAMSKGNTLKYSGGGKWIQKAIKHPGRCTPLSNPECTGHARALALTFKKYHGFHKKK